MYSLSGTAFSATLQSVDVNITNSYNPVFAESLVVEKRKISAKDKPQSNKSIKKYSIILDK